MSDAKKCDNCGELFEKSSEANDPHQVTVRQRGDWEHPAIGARISLYNEREHGLIDDCRKCTILAVRKFMVKFGIPERKGESFTGTMVDENAGSFSEFFAGFSGKRVRITVEVL